VRLFLIGGALVIAVLLAAMGVLWFFGSPQSSPVASPTGTVPAVAQDGGAAATAPSGAPAGEGDVSVTSTVAPPPDPSTPLAIEIPGCVCHSDDPEIVEEHSQYRMNQCMGCHAGQIPTGE
jgi:hypothetical protein